MESVAAGMLLKVLRVAGETVLAGSPVAYIGAPGEAVPPSHAGADGSIGAGSADVATATAAAESPTLTLAPHLEPERRLPDETTGRISALPAARRLASELGIDLTTVGGTGPDGVITVRDVEQAAQEASVLVDGPEGGAT